MKMLRSISFLLITGSLICFLVAYEIYNRALKAGRAIAERLPQIEFESVAIPRYTYIGFFAGVLLLAAGIFCYLEYRKQIRENGGNQLLG